MPGTFAIGVAVADKPTGPFIPQREPIKGVHGIDPNVFIDKDVQVYLYWSQGNIYGANIPGKRTRSGTFHHQQRRIIG